MALNSIFNFLLPVSFAVDMQCDYFQFMEIGREYYVYNQGYPNNYRSGSSCRWIAQSLENTKIILSCADINIPQSDNCLADYLSISLTGSTSLTDGHRYCGYGNLNLVSQSNSLAIGLFSTWYSSGGRFACSMTVIEDEYETIPTPPPVQTMPTQNSCDCGWRKPRRIVGGVQTGINEFPYMAALVDITASNLYCGAAIVSRKYAVTVAHCVENRRASKIGLLVGDHDVSTGFETNAADLYTLERIIKHPNYDNKTSRHDIAVVKTQNVMDFSVEVGPICLPFKYTNRDFTGETVTVLGWGTTEFSGPKSDYLQAANLTVVSNWECQNQLGNNQIYKTQICSYGDGKDSCQYDSGGPLVWHVQRQKRDQLLGLISYGLGCASNFPSVNTKVSSYLAWIVSVTSDAPYCIK